MESFRTATDFSRVAIDFFRAALDFLLPRRCLVCGRELGLKEKHLCLGCMADLPITRNWLARHNPMADQFNALVEKMRDGPEEISPRGPLGLGRDDKEGQGLGRDDKEGRGLGRDDKEGLGLGREDRPGPGRDDSPSAPEPYANAAALLLYRGDSPYSRIPQSLKYGGNIAAGRYFARMLGAQMAQQPHWQDVDAVIPVPLHWRRKHSRGYNQAEIIAQELAKALNAKLYPSALKRVKRTGSQTSLSAEQRLKNVQGVFAAKQLPENARHIVLVDDTFTTGATLAACYGAVRDAIGIEAHISIATLAAVSG